jgi:cell fate (sporulation/competence/biofilm development) regulator YlbF (YheA/YmcA/DUF963 family)
MGKREELLENIRRAKKELEDYDKQQELLEAARQVKMAFDTMVSQGFTETQAMTIMVNTLKGVK